MKLLIILLFSISQCFAIDVAPIKKGAPAPNDGFFITVEAMKDLRKINEEKKILRKENLKLTDLSIVNEHRIVVYRKLSEESGKALRREQTKGNVKGIGGFIIGVLATSVVAYAAIRVAK